MNGRSCCSSRRLSEVLSETLSEEDFPLGDSRSCCLSSCFVPETLESKVFFLVREKLKGNNQRAKDIAVKLSFRCANAQPFLCNQIGPFQVISGNFQAI